MRKLVILSLAILFTLPSQADEGPVGAVGGTVKLLDGHPSVRMVSEYVYMKLTESKVSTSCRFVFHNEGKAVTVKMGFPQDGKHDPESDYFRASVDGKPVAIQHAEGEMELQEVTRDWWVKSVHFNSGQTRVVEDEYGGSVAIDETDQARFATYVLKTGGPWHGPIGKATIVMDVSAFHGYQTIHATPSGYRRHGDRITWTLRNFEPKQDIRILCYWGYRPERVVVNGREMAGAVLAWNAPSELATRDTMPRITNGILIVPARSFVYFTDLRRRDFVFDNQTVSMTFGAKVLRLIPGSRTAFIGDERIMLPVAPRLAHGRLMVPLQATIEALGSKMTHDRKRSRIYINSPKPTT